MSAYLYDPTTSTDFESSEAYTTNSKGFEISESDADDRLEMEDKLLQIKNDFKISKQRLVYSTEGSIEETSMNVGPQQNLEWLKAFQIKASEVKPIGEFAQDIFQPRERKSATPDVMDTDDIQPVLTASIDEKVIQENMRSIQETVPAAAGVNDGIPQRVHEKLTEVTQLARSGNASTFTASSCFESTKDAFDYGRQAALNQFNLKRDSRRTLEEYDEKFLSVIKCQIDVEMDQAEFEMSECLQILAKASRESRDDQSQLEERQNEENQLVTLDQLDKIYLEATEELKGEEEEYAVIEQNCQKDAQVIDRSLQELEEVMESALSIHGLRDAERSQKLETNRKEQEDLRERLRQLEAEEQEYLRVRKEEEEMITTGMTEYERAKEDLTEWKEKVELLGKQANTSLVILNVMKGCTEEILSDAKQRKKAWQDKLQKLEVESLLNTRDVLMATICLHKMEAADCSTNLEETEKDIAKKKVEINHAARKRFKPKVEELQAALKSNEGTFQQYKEKLDSHNAKISEIAKQLTVVTERIRTLRPGISLSSVETTYRERNRIKDDCFDKAGVEEARKKLNSCSLVEHF